MKEGRRQGKEKKPSRSEVVRLMLANATCPLKDGQKYPTPYSGRHDDETIALALKDSGGVIVRAAVLLGVTRATVRARIDKSEMLLDVMDDIEGARNDLVEEALYGNALLGDSKAQIFILTEKGQDRGYGNKKQSGADDATRALELFRSAVERIAEAAPEIRAIAAPEQEPIEVECSPVGQPEGSERAGEDDLW